MGVLKWLDDKILCNKRLEYVVKKYGPDFISTYVGGALFAVGTALAGAGSLVPLIAIPAAAALISFVNQLDRNYKYNELTDFYRDQIASRLNKRPKEVTRDDLHTVAYGDEKIGLCENNVLKSELQHIDRERNASIITHALSALAVGGLVSFAHAAGPLLQFLHLPVGQLGVGIGSLLMFQQVDRGLGEIGSTVFNTKSRTAHDGIMELQELLHKGQKVSRMQIFTVIAAADKDLQKQIRERFGTGFDDLYLSDKRQAMVEFGISRKLNEICRALNSGKMESEDLALTLCGMAPAPHYQYTKTSRYGLRGQAKAEEHSTDPVAGLDFFSASDNGKDKSDTYYHDRIASEREQGAAIDAPGSFTIQ